MSVKQIPVSEILETPDVNILNDNVLDKVDYRYNQTKFEYQSVFNGNIYLYKFPEPYTGGSKNTTYYFQDVPTSAYQLNVSYYKRNTEDNSKNINKIKQSIPNYGSLIYYYDFVSFQYTDNSVGKEEYKIDWDTVQSGFRTGFDNGDYLIVQYPVTDTTERYNVVNSYQEVLDLWFNLDSNNNIISSKYNSGSPSICVIKNGSIYTIYMLFLSSITNTANTEMYRVDTQFNFSILRNKIKTSTIEVDNNSSFALQSNELITQNTLYKGTNQISEYISEDIKANYKNGKATMKLNCVYNGENEYHVGDIVVPMKDRFNPVLSDSDGSAKLFEITSSEISFAGRGTQILETVEVSYPPASDWVHEEWSGQVGYGAPYVWTDGENVYYSNGADKQFVLDKTTNTWQPKIWNGQTNIYGGGLWTDGENIYYSSQRTHYVLDKSNKTWTQKAWYGLVNSSGETFFYASNIWTDGNNIYYSDGLNKQFVLNKSTSVWEVKIWNGTNTINGENVWTDGNDIYYSDGLKYGQYKLNKATSTWEQYTWGVSSVYDNKPLVGDGIWTDGRNLYHSYGTDNYLYNKITNTWDDKIWEGKKSFDASYIWTNGKDIYIGGDGYERYVLQGTHYLLKKVNCKTATSLRT